MSSSRERDPLSVRKNDLILVPSGSFKQEQKIAIVLEVTKNPPDYRQQIRMQVRCRVHGSVRTKVLTCSDSRPPSWIIL